MIWRIAQDQTYHLFADGRTLLGIANAADTLSSGAFLVVGVLGLVFLWRARAPPADRDASSCRRRCAPAGLCSPPWH